MRARFPGDDTRVARMSLIDESGDKHVRMAHLAIVGSHSTNGVSEIHTDLLRTHTVSDFAEMFPERFNNKTNGVTPRRWLRLANPALSQCDFNGDWRRLDHEPGAAARAEAARGAIVTFVASSSRRSARRSCSSLTG